MAESFLVNVCDRWTPLHLRFEFRGLRLEDDRAGDLRLGPDSDDPDDSLIVGHDLNGLHVPIVVRDGVHGDEVVGHVRAALGLPLRKRDRIREFSVNTCEGVRA